LTNRPRPGRPTPAPFSKTTSPREMVTPSPLNPLGLKGVGESGALPVAAVVASAVEDALTERGIRVERMPLTPGTLRWLVWPEFAG
jgi:carbon-monoxide dehydrogenase large subunit